VRDVAYVALGSNLGDRAAYLAAARDAIGRLPGTRVLLASDVEETEPVGPVAQGAYLNQMLAIETELVPGALLAALLVPGALLAALLDIERMHGRVRDVRWGPRTLDLDIVLFERQQVAEPGLVVPHPELPRRDFWRRELEEIRQA